MRDRRRRLLMLGWLAAASPVACLPAGDPPAGRQVLAGRDRTLVGILPPRSPDDGVARLLVARANSAAQGDSDLFLLSARDATGTAQEQLLVEHWNSGYCGVACIPVDYAGRLYVTSTPDLTAGQSVTRIDPVTGDRFDLGLAGDVQLSPSGQRVALYVRDAVTGSQNVELVEADDRITTLADGSYGQFGGEDFYALDATNVLWRAPPGAVPQALKTNVANFRLVNTPAGLRVFVAAVTAAPSMNDPFVEGPGSLLDPLTLQERTLVPDAQRLDSFSPDGAWALVRTGTATFDENEYAFVDLATGAADPFTLAMAAGSPQWRPGHAEAWFSTGFTNSGTAFVTIARPNTPLLSLAVFPISVERGTRGTSTPYTIFTDDGSHWFSLPGDQELYSSRQQIFVGNSDDPAGARYPINPDGTTLFASWEVSGGRLVVEASYVDNPGISDIVLVDPTNGDMQLLGKEGVVLNAWEQRILANLRVVNGGGDLTVVDLDRGRSTVLAAEFARSAFVQAPQASPETLQPGARIAFQFAARFESPYDGIWVATLP